MLIAVIAAALLTTGATAQTQPNPAVAEVRQTLDAARKEIDAYKSAGGAAGAADHPAVTWDARLWAYREQYPGSDAAALATAEAVRLLVRAELWDRAHARIESVGVDDSAWDRLPAVVYDEGIARKDLPYTIDTLERVAASSTTPSIKAASLIIVGRAYRRQKDKDAAIAALEAAKAAAPGTKYAEDAEGLIYEIRYLSPGVLAPAVKGKTRNGRAIDLAALRGKAVVLVFWGTT